MINLKNSKLLVSLTATMFMLFSVSTKAEDLVEVLQIAFENNYAYKSQIEQFNAEYVNKGLANSYLLPTINLGADLNSARSKITYQSDRNLDYNNSNHSTGVFLVQPLYDMTAWASFSRGKLLAERALVLLDKNKNDVALKSVQYYFDVLSAIDDVEYVDAKIKYYSTYMRETEQKVKVGQAKPVDVDEVRAKYEEARYTLIIMNNNLQVKKDVLNKFINQDVKKYLKVKESLSDIVIKDKDMASWTQRARTQNLDVLYSQLGILIADEQVSIANAGYYPILSLVGAYNLSGGKDLYLQGEKYRGNQASVGLSLSMNLYEGGATYNYKKQAKATKYSEEYSAKELANNVESLTKQYYLNVANGLAQLDALQSSVIASERSLESAQQSYFVGLKTTTDVLIATEDYFDARRGYSKSKYDFLLSILALKAVTGTISVEDIKLINGYIE